MSLKEALTNSTFTLLKYTACFSIIKPKCINKISIRHSQKPRNQILFAKTQLFILFSEILGNANCKNCSRMHIYTQNWWKWKTYCMQIWTIIYWFFAIFSNFFFYLVYEALLVGYSWFVGLWGNIIAELEWK